MYKRYTSAMHELPVVIPPKITDVRNRIYRNLCTGDSALKLNLQGPAYCCL